MGNFKVKLKMKNIILKEIQYKEILFNKEIHSF